MGQKGLSLMNPNSLKFFTREEVQHILANMMFNMGRPRLSGFKKFNAAVAAGEWEEAAEEMIDSRWYRQVTNRADRLVTRMRAV